MIDADTTRFVKVSDRFWDFVSEDGTVFARAELFPGKDQWGVRLLDRAPDLDDRELTKLVGKLLVWEVGCTADTVEVVLGRSHDRVTMVRVQGEYV